MTTKITGHSHLEGNVNIRSQAKVANNIVGKLAKGDVFTGELVEVGLEKWISLTSVNGIKADGFIAAWVITIDTTEIVEEGNPTDEIPAGFDEVLDATLTLRNTETGENLVVKLVPVKE